MKRYIAFDPGLDGGICVLDSSDGGHVIVMDDIVMPTLPTGRGTRRDYDERALADIVRNWAMPKMLGDTVLVIERQQPFPKQGGVSNFTLGNGFGLLKGIAVGMGLSYHCVGPRTWQKVIYEGVPGEGKERSVIACRRMYPDNPLPIVGVRVKRVHDGCADARCIATWAGRVGL